MKPVRTRFAPSPTGVLHIGGARTALFAFLFARHHGGTFILRVEDTDQARSVPGSMQQIIESLGLLGITIDEGPSHDELRAVGEYWEGAPALGGEKGPYIQSLRSARYREVAEQLVSQGVAYRCDCTPEMLERERNEQMARREVPGYSGYCRDRNVSKDVPHVIRVRVPQGKSDLVLQDAVRGRITWDDLSLRDTVILKQDGTSLYHLASVVDDHDMEITHVIRGEEWIATTPVHLLMYRALGWEPPIFAHVSAVLGTDGKKLSKRHGAAAVEQFLEAGYLPEALRNYVSLVGWSPGEGEGQEIFSLEELAQRFTLEGLSASAGVFDEQKLAWMNGVYLRNLTDDEFVARVQSYFPEGAFARCAEEFRQLAGLVKERIKLLTEAPEMVEFLYRDDIVPEYASALKKGMTTEIAVTLINEAIPALEAVTEWSHDSLESLFRTLAESHQLKVGPAFTVFRIAVLGKAVTPPLFESMAVLGKERVLERLRQGVRGFRGEE
jgi:glutamyl-tRNA synthetase